MIIRKTMMAIKCSYAYFLEADSVWMVHAAHIKGKMIIISKLCRRSLHKKQTLNGLSIILY